MNHPEETVIILSTAPPSQSRTLIQALIDRRLVACVNVVPVQSFYRWKGEFCDEQEHLMIAKTTKAKAGEVIDAIKASHSYELPEIITLPVTGGYIPYLKWVDEETRESA